MSKQIVKKSKHVRTCVRTRAKGHHERRFGVERTAQNCASTSEAARPTCARMFDTTCSKDTQSNSPARYPSEITIDRRTRVRKPRPATGENSGPRRPSDPIAHDPNDPSRSPSQWRHKKISNLVRYGTNCSTAVALPLTGAGNNCDTIRAEACQTNSA